MINNWIYFILYDFILKKTWNFFLVDLQKNFRNMCVIKNKLSLSDQRGKSMHYPESPKVSIYTFIILLNNRKGVIRIKFKVMLTYSNILIVKVQQNISNKYQSDFKLGLGQAQNPERKISILPLCQYFVIRLILRRPCSWHKVNI